EEGIAAISDTTVHGQHCLRVAINNHRTRREDLGLLVRETVRLGREISRAGAALPSPLVGEGGCEAAG
ncbi:MAG: amino acid decarboxylase, partial [Mesorhizobium sp.]